MPALSNFEPVRSTTLEDSRVMVQLTGNTSAAPTVSTPPFGVSLARTSAGLYTLTFNEFLGVFLGAWGGFQNATPANVAGWSLVAGTWTQVTSQGGSGTASEPTLVIATYNSSEVATDPATGTTVWLEVFFKRANTAL